MMSNSNYSIGLQRMKVQRFKVHSKRSGYGRDWGKEVGQEALDLSRDPRGHREEKGSNTPRRQGAVSGVVCSLKERSEI